MYSLWAWGSFYRAKRLLCSRDEASPGVSFVEEKWKGFWSGNVKFLMSAWRLARLGNAYFISRGIWIKSGESWEREDANKCGWETQERARENAPNKPKRVTETQVTFKRLSPLHLQLRATRRHSAVCWRCEKPGAGSSRQNSTFTGLSGNTHEVTQRGELCRHVIWFCVKSRLGPARRDAEKEWGGQRI